MPPDQRVLDQLSLTREEYERILDVLDREPSDVELGMFGAMWSEHCGYKNSKPLLGTFPSEGAGVLTKAGEENAGVIDIGDGLCVAFKIESHNHPSAIEPYEGAATGVGGIVRDIFAMGARPVALLDSLRFGPLQPSAGGGAGATRIAGLPPEAFLPPTSADAASRNRHLFRGVVSGIGGYGNCIGIPTVGGETSFAPGYSGNPLVNAMCIGIARSDRLVRARADGPGNILLLVGADTGRDGIHGATFASVQLDASSEERRPAVQVGNPFLEKLLMEACLQLTEEHHDWVVGLQDLGAAGLTSSTVECAAKAGTGLIIDVENVPRRESGMTPYEVMLSESQERMLVIVRPEHEEPVRALFERWELHCERIGTVTDDGIVRIREHGVQAGALPARALTAAPTYTREPRKPASTAALQAVGPATLASITRDAVARAGGATAALRALLASPEIASRRIVWRQYDHQVGTNTVTGPGSDAAVIRIKGTTRAIAAATDGNAALTHLDPWTGGAIAVAEAVRNVACSGARPLGMTNCLNFGNPEKPEVYFQLEQAIGGMAAAARALAVPVISGNVSLYNETNGDPIWPTPVVGIVGLIEDVARTVRVAFHDGDVVFLAGGVPDEAGLAGAVFLQHAAGIVAGMPRLDLEAEAALGRFLVAAAEDGALRSAHDVSGGGLAVTLAECCIAGGVGIDGTAFGALDDALLFAETQSLAVVACARDDARALAALASAHGVPLREIGSVGGGRLRFAGIDATVNDLAQAYESGLGDALSGV